MGENFHVVPQATINLSRMLCPASIAEVLSKEIIISPQGDHPHEATVTLEWLLNTKLHNIRAEHWRLEGGVVRSLLTRGLLEQALKPWASEEELVSLLSKPCELLNDIDLCGSPHGTTSLYSLRADLIALAASLLNLEFAQAEKCAFVSPPHIPAGRPFLVAKLGQEKRSLLEFKLTSQNPYLFTIDQLTLSLDGKNYLLESKGPEPMQTLIDYYGRIIRAPDPLGINSNGFPRILSWMTKGFRSVDPQLSKLLWNTFHTSHSTNQAIAQKFASCLRNHHSDDAAVHVAYYMQASQLLSETGIPSTEIEELWPVWPLPKTSSEVGAGLQQLGQRLQSNPEQLPWALALLQVVAWTLYHDPDENSGIQITRSSVHQSKEYWEFHLNTPEPCAIFLPIGHEEALKLLSTHMETGMFDPFDWGSFGQLIISPRDSQPLHWQGLMWQRVLQGEPSPAKTAWACNFLRTLLKKYPNEFTTYLEQAGKAELFRHAPKEGEALFNALCAHLATFPEPLWARRGKLATLENFRQTLPLTVATRSSTAWFIEQLYHHDEKDKAMQLLEQADAQGLFDLPSKAATRAHGVKLEAIAAEKNPTRGIRRLVAEHESLASHPQYIDVWTKVLTPLLTSNPQEGRRWLCEAPKPLRANGALLALALDERTPPIEIHEAKKLYKILVELEKQKPIPRLWMRFASHLKSDDENQVKQLWHVLLTHIPVENDNLSLSELHSLALRALELTEVSKSKLGAKGKQLAEGYLSQLMRKLLDAGRWEEAKQLLLQSPRCDLCSLPSSLFEDIYITIAIAERKLAPADARGFAIDHLRLAGKYYPGPYRQLLLGLADDALQEGQLEHAKTLVQRLAAVIDGDAWHTYQNLRAKLARLQLRRGEVERIANDLISSDSCHDYTPEDSAALLFDALTLWSCKGSQSHDLARFILDLPISLPKTAAWRQLQLSLARELIKTPPLNEAWILLRDLDLEDHLPPAKELLQKAIAKKDLNLGWDIAKDFPQTPHLEQLMISASTRNGHQECIHTLVRYAKNKATPSKELIAGCLQHIHSLRKRKNEHKKMLELFSTHSSVHPPELVNEHLHTDDPNNIKQAVAILCGIDWTHADGTLISYVERTLNRLLRHPDFHPREVIYLLKVAEGLPTLHKHILPTASFFLEKALEGNNISHIKPLAQVISKHLKGAADKKSYISQLNKSTYLILKQASRTSTPDYKDWIDLIVSGILTICKTEPLLNFYLQDYLEKLTDEQPESERLISMITPQVESILELTLTNLTNDRHWQYQMLQRLCQQAARWPFPNFKLQSMIILKKAYDVGTFSDALIPLKNTLMTALGEHIGGEPSSEDLMVKLCEKMIRTLNEGDPDETLEDAVGYLVEQQLDQVILKPTLVHALLEDWASLLTSSSLPKMSIPRKATFLRLFMSTLERKCEGFNPNQYLELVRSLHPELINLSEINARTVGADICVPLMAALIDLENSYKNMGLCTSLNIRDGVPIQLFIHCHEILTHEQAVLNVLDHYRRMAWLAKAGGIVNPRLLLLSEIIAKLTLYCTSHSHELFKFHVHMGTSLYEDTLTPDEKIAVVRLSRKRSLLCRVNFPIEAPYWSTNLWVFSIEL